MENIIQIIGWIGTIMIVMAYFLVSYKKVDSQSRSYQLINLLGALFVGVSVFYQRAWPALGLQVAWALIAIFSIFRRGRAGN